MHYRSDNIMVYFSPGEDEKLKIMLQQRGIECKVKILNALGQEKHNIILNFIRDETSMIVK